MCGRLIEYFNQFFDGKQVALFLLILSSCNLFELKGFMQKRAEEKKSKSYYARC